MKLPTSGGDFKIAPAGNHLAICNAVVDLGIQPGSGKFPDPKHQIYIRFELPDEPVEYEKDGQKISGPASLGATYTASMGEKANLRKLVQGWRGATMTDAQAADFDLQKLLGQKCLLNVVHKDSGGKTYANILGATPLPKSMKSDVAQANPSLYFDLDKPNAEVFAKLPKWLQDKITTRLVPEKHDTDPGFSAEDERAEEFDDQIPF
jgi:hypothetical protein